jgi:hypothetical protein
LRINPGTPWYLGAVLINVSLACSREIGFGSLNSTITVIMTVSLRMMKKLSWVQRLLKTRECTYDIDDLAKFAATHKVL